MATKRIHNFNAGPAALPLEVLKQAQKELLSWHNQGLSVMEMSHRSKEFESILNDAIKDLRDLLTIPKNYRVLFLPAGGMGEFAAIPMNLARLSKSGTFDYIVTGGWSQRAAQEAAKYGHVNIVCNGKKDNFTSIPSRASWKLSDDAAYVYYCANETVHGVEFDEIPDVNGKILVADFSSSFCSQPIDVSKFGIVYAGVQKNVGPAGATIVIIREDLIGKAMKCCPSVLTFAEQAKNNSLLNTPPAFCIYMCGLVFKWLKQQGGLEGIQALNQKKSEMIYNVIDSSGGFYTCPVKRSVRSRMNVVFHIGGPRPGNDTLHKLFVQEAKKAGMIGLAGHRSAGGMRASIYNAVGLDSCEALASFMRRFQQKYQNRVAVARL